MFPVVIAEINGVMKYGGEDSSISPGPDNQ